MPIQLSQISEDPLYHGHVWTVGDEDKLAHIVAVLLLGRRRHAEAILEGKTMGDILASDAMVDALVGKLKVPSGDNPQRWHRDGWLFQMISWIAADASLASAADLIAPPQPRAADKGLDGLLILAHDGVDHARLVICEDKASTDPRGTFRDDVCPELLDFEADRRNNEIAAALDALLDAVEDATAANQIIDRLVWQEKKSYRVSMVVGDDHSTPSGRKKLFKNYDSTVPGPLLRRRAETIHLSDMRAWFETFAQRVIEHLDSFRPADV
ncbi:MAG TPA: hypothetical protein VEU30_13165 [Thermoanaerobaculia bacterium]|nr:hypothetical protein [Thermoanaerobaculia bacterium]